MASLVRRGLRDDGMTADVAIKGEHALWMAGSANYDVMHRPLESAGRHGDQGTTTSPSGCGHATGSLNSSPMRAARATTG